MRSKNTLFNKTLYLKQIMRIWPVWSLVSLGGFFVAVAMAMNVVTFNKSRNDLINNFRYAYFNAASIMPAVIMAYVFIISVSVFSYLYSRRSIDFMHSLPVSRGGLYTSTVLAGLTMTAGPFFVWELVFSIGAATKGIFLCGPFFTALWSIISSTIIFFAIGTLASQLVGRFFAQIMMYGVLNFIFAFGESMIDYFARGFLYGVPELFTRKLEFLSPVIYITGHTYYASVYDIVNPMDMGADDALPGKFEGLDVMSYYAIAGLLILAASYFIYKHRKSEAASEVLAFNALKPVVLYVLSGLGAVISTFILSRVFDFANYPLFRLTMVLPFMLLSTVICYFVGKMIIERTVRVFTSRSMINALIFAAVMMCGTFLLSLDIPKIHEYIPESSDVEFAYVEYLDDRYCMFEGEEGLTECVMDVQRKIIDNGPAPLSEWKEVNGYYDMYYGYGVDRIDEYADKVQNFLSITYILKDGSKVARSYPLIVSKDRIEDPDTVEYALDNLLNLEPMREKEFVIDTTPVEYDIWWGNIYFNDYINGDYKDVQISNQDMPLLKEAMLNDLREGNIDRYNILYSDIYEGDYSISVDVNRAVSQYYYNDYMYRYGNGEYEYYKYDQWTQFVLYPGFENVCNMLLDKGYMTMDEYETLKK